MLKQVDEHEAASEPSSSEPAVAVGPYVGTEVGKAAGQAVGALDGHAPSGHTDVVSPAPPDSITSPSGSAIAHEISVGHEPEAMRRYRAMLTMMSDEATAAKLDELRNAAALELNPKHAVIKGIERLRREAAKDGERGEKARIAKLLAEQVFDNARVAAGALDDPREMVGRIHEILEIALERLDEPEPEPQPRREEAASAKKK